MAESRNDQRNVFGEPLVECCAKPLTGFYRTGNCWCLCAARWLEAFEAGKAPKVRLTATHEATLEIVPLDLLKKHALDLS
jgi:uncharacterized protein (DUF2237 family)